MRRARTFTPTVIEHRVLAYGPEPIGAATAHSLQAQYGAAMAGAMSRVTFGEPSDPSLQFQGPCTDPQEFRGAARGHGLVRFPNAELPNTSAPPGTAITGVQGLLAGLP